MTYEAPQCSLGYTSSQVERIVGDKLDDFNRWMDGQTMSLCDGRAYNHSTEEYEVACNGEHHGIIVYAWDLDRYLAGLRVID